MTLQEVLWTLVCGSLVAASCNRQPKVPARRAEAPAGDVVDVKMPEEPAPQTAGAAKVIPAPKPPTNPEDAPERPGGSPMEVDYQKLLDRSAFAWREQEASILYSLSQMAHDYKVRIEYDPGRRSELDIAILKANEVLWNLGGHRHTVFKIHEDVLYYPLFHFSASGCRLVAYDLRAERELWRTDLRGLGGVEHSAYLNKVTIDVNDDVVTVHGRESYGDYVECVGRRTGQTVAHRTYRKGFEPQLAEPVQLVLEYIDQTKISNVDRTSGKIIHSTQEYWDVAFQIPDAVAGGEKPDARIFRVKRSDGSVKELGTD